jgi:hypothetical protein
MEPEPTLRTVLDGQPVTLPGSIAAIRDQLAPEQRAEFDHEVEHAEAAALPAVLARWALTTAGADPADLFDRLAAGDDLGARELPDPGHPEVA